MQRRRGPTRARRPPPAHVWGSRDGRRAAWLLPFDHPAASPTGQLVGARWTHAGQLLEATQLSGVPHRRVTAEATVPDFEQHYVPGVELPARCRNAQVVALMDHAPAPADR